ncbi:MAG TPA: colicin V production protein [Bacteroidales bacterium]|nr:colicin V production protein [Bacteroidales bacterium]
MNYIDIIILAFLAWAIYRGFKNGLFIEIASIAALVLGIWGSIRFSWFTQDKLVKIFDMQGQYLGLVAFIITFIVIVVLIHFLARAIDKLMKAVALGFAVRILGAVFAVLKTVLIMSIIFVVLNTINQKAKFLPAEKISESKLYKPVSDFAPLLFPIIEGNDLRKSFDNLRNRKNEKSKEGTII